MLSRLYAVVGWIIIAIGLVGSLNLLHRAYGASCFRVRLVCRTANVLPTLLAIAAGIVMRVSLGECLVIWLLLFGALILSFSALIRLSRPSFSNSL
jgi:hypothetical protein